jgi:beta-phosphoglucomutase
MRCIDRQERGLGKIDFRAVLFDFDGVIGNTMDDNFRAWRAAFAEQGIEMKKKEYFLMEGATTRAVAEFFLHQGHCDPSLAEQVVQSKERHYLEHHHFALYEGVEPLIATLKKNTFRLGVVSGANKKRLSALGIDPFLANFDVIVTGDETPRGKPDPEPFLLAARKLDVFPKDCVVVENAPYGIASAKKAGMYCVAVCSTLDAAHLNAADKIVKGIAEVAEILAG